MEEFFRGKLESLHQAQWPRGGHISLVKWVSWLSFIEYSLCLEHAVITVLGRWTFLVIVGSLGPCIADGAADG